MVDVVLVSGSLFLGSVVAVERSSCEGCRVVVVTYSCEGFGGECVGLSGSPDIDLPRLVDSLGSLGYKRVYFDRGVDPYMVAVVLLALAHTGGGFEVRAVYRDGYATLRPGVVEALINGFRLIRSEKRVLEAVSRGYNSPGIIAARLGYSEKSVAKALARLQRLGLVRRREKHYTVTGMGRLVLKKLSGRKITDYTIEH